MRIRHAFASLVSLALAVPVAAQVEPSASPPPPPPDGRLVATPAPAPAKAKGSPITAFYDEGTVLRSENGAFELRLGGRIQTRYEMARSLADDQEFNQRFLIPRSRITMDGHVFTRAVKYKFEGGFSDGGNPRLRAFFIDAEIAPGVVIRAGQSKRPFNRQELVSDFGTELPEKALTNEFAQGGYDIGVAVHNNFDRSPDGIEWAVGLFNGTGDRAVPRATTTCVDGMPPTCTTTVGTPSNVPTDFQPQLVARLGVNLGGIKGYTEPDLEGGPLRLAAAVSYKLMNIQDTDAAPLSHGFEIDMMLKVAGLSVQAAGILMKSGEADARFGGHAQAGFFLTPRKLQLAARFGATPLAVAAGASQEYLLEARGGPQYYFWGQGLKLSTDIGALQSTADGADAELQARVQAQLIF